MITPDVVHLTFFLGIVPWEGSNDQYRQACRNGGIACNGFLHAWFPRQCSSNLYPGKGVA